MRVPSPVLLLALAVPALAQATSVPTDVQLPGTQPGEASLESATRCDNCHGGYDPDVEPAHNWRGSLMAHATRDPLFWATVAVAEQDFPGAGDLCIRCHTPDGWLRGRSTPTDGSDLTAGDAEGVSCDTCHQLTNPDDSEHLGVQVAPFVANDGGTPPVGYYGSGMAVMFGQADKLGPYDPTVARHQYLQSSFHRSSELCGTCHDVSNPVVGDLAPTNGAMKPLPPGSFSGVPGSPVDGKAAFNNFPYAYGIVERTFSEHVASGFPGLPVSAYGTLPSELQDGSIERAYQAAVAAVPPLGNYVDGTTRTFTCQTCHLPPLPGRGANKQNAPTREDLPHHDMTGGSSWMPAAIRWLDDQGRLPLRPMTQAERDGLAAGAARALSNLQEAAELEVLGNQARVVNLTGHKLPTGYPEGRRMWLNVRWRAPGGRLLREDGAYGALAVTHRGAPLQVESLLDLQAPNLRIWETKPGITREWAQTLIQVGVAAGLALGYDRLDGSVTETLNDLASAAPGTAWESFHFVLNDRITKDNRIPPWAMSWDAAEERNIHPVPAGQYGASGTGEVYEHWDDVPLAPPLGAVDADIDLLYQSTSWEYIQFLSLANDGSVGFLANTGQDMLDAWLANGMAPPVVMASDSWTGDPGDCNHNGVPDAQEIAGGLLPDCNGNGVPDSCDIVWLTSRDRDGNGVPDECEKPHARPERPLIPAELSLAGLR